MAKYKGFTQREAFGTRLSEIGPKYPDIVVFDADLSVCTYGFKFREVCPERYFNLGIAEANMISAAAGAATTGKNVFACSFAMFTAGRAYEQIRNSCAYPKLNVKIIGTYSGITVGEDGATHQCIEDLALMRVIPGMTVLNPADAYETICMVDALAEFNGPAYVRLPRDPVTEWTDKLENYRFEIGKGVLMADGKDVTIFATGFMVNEAMLAKKKLGEQGISARVINIHTIKPLDEDIVCKAAKETGAIVTAEEHNILGGLGGAITEAVTQYHPVPVIRVGVQDQFGKSGDIQSLVRKYHLSSEDIMEAAKKAIKNK